VHVLVTLFPLKIRSPTASSKVLRVHFSNVKIVLYDGKRRGVFLIKRRKL
jgi:hypothetical protein